MKTLITSITLAILALQSLNAQQEKRLALVIGNANYDKGALNNPVNDALLMAKTLDSLKFDVILDTNIKNKSEFMSSIREFGNKRDEYDLAIVYYAGHGIQIDGDNYMLPTKQKFENKFDVMDFAINVQSVMRYLTNVTGHVNILILDACRDNPFEEKWNQSRSLKGNGLNKIPPPAGSLIAYSTDAGSTAADGQNQNSLYVQSLSKNLLLEDVTIEQVFKNVRAEILKETNGAQIPVEESKLVGKQVVLRRTLDLNLANFEEIREYSRKMKPQKKVDFLQYAVSTKKANNTTKGVSKLENLLLATIIEFSNENINSIFQKGNFRNNKESAQTILDVYRYEPNMKILGLLNNLDNTNTSIYNSLLSYIKKMNHELDFWLTFEADDHPKELVDEIINHPFTILINTIASKKKYFGEVSLFTRLQDFFVQGQKEWAGRVIKKFDFTDYQLTIENYSENEYAKNCTEKFKDRIWLLNQYDISPNRFNPDNRIDSIIFNSNRNVIQKRVRELELNAIQDAGSILDSTSLKNCFDDFVFVLESITNKETVNSMTKLNDIKYYDYPLTFSIFQLIGTVVFNFGFDSKEAETIRELFQHHVNNLKKVNDHFIENAQGLEYSEWANIINENRLYALYPGKDSSEIATIAELVKNFYEERDKARKEGGITKELLHLHYQLSKLQYEFYEKYIEYSKFNSTAKMDRLINPEKVGNWANKTPEHYSGGMDLAKKLIYLEHQIFRDIFINKEKYNSIERDRRLFLIIKSTIIPYNAEFNSEIDKTENYFSQLDFILWFNFYDKIFEANHTCSDIENLFNLYYIGFIMETNKRLDCVTNFSYVEKILSKMLECKKTLSEELDIITRDTFLKLNTHLSNYYGEEDMSLGLDMIEKIIGP